MKTTRLLCSVLLTLSVQFAIIAESSLSINCPDDVWLGCDDEIWTLSIYGNATYSDHYGTHSAGTPSVKYYLNACNTGYITRTWTVEDEYWNQVSCTQHIYVFGNNFTAGNIHWPEPEVALEGCNPNTHPNTLDPKYGPPTYDYRHCSHIGVSHKDQTFTFGPDCKKILRTWTVIDWCTYHPNYNSNKGIWTFYQTIKISATESPEVECLDDITVSSFNCKGSKVILPTVKIDDSTCGGSYVIEHNSVYADTTGANASGVYPIGTTEIKYRIVYGCGQIHYCKQKIKVIDDKRPGAYCYGGLAISLMGVDSDNDGVFDDGMVEIWAKDLDRGSFQACHASDLYYSFSPDIDSTSRLFTCADIGKNLVRMYVTDHYGHQSYCIVELDVQNNGANIPNCSPTSTKEEPKQNIAGTIDTYRGERLENSFIDLNSMEMETVLIETGEEPIVIYTEEILDSFFNNSGAVVYDKLIDSIVLMQYDTSYNYREFEAFSNDNGYFKFEEIGMDFEYKLQPWRIYGLESDLNIFDVQALFNHVVGRTILDNPYQLIAGDINKDQELTIKDVDLLLAYIQGDKQIIENRDRWTFIDRVFEFDEDENALQQAYPEYIMIGEGQELTAEQGFIAIRIGDIDDRNVNTSIQSKTFAEEIETEIRNYGNSGMVEIEFAPNPFTDYTRFSIKGEITGNYRLEIYNSNGQLIFESTSDRQSITVDEIYKSGVYIYRLAMGNQHFEGRIVKI